MRVQVGDRIRVITGSVRLTTIKWGATSIRFASENPCYTLQLHCPPLAPGRGNEKTWVKISRVGEGLGRGQEGLRVIAPTIYLDFGKLPPGPQFWGSPIVPSPKIGGRGASRKRSAFLIYQSQITICIQQAPHEIMFTVTRALWAKQTSRG